MRPAADRISLPKDFHGIVRKCDLTDVIRDRHSARVYTQENMTLPQLSYLLWTSHGIKDIRSKAYATLRTVPCGGARHEIETYLLVRQIEGLEAGAYHYLPMEHALEYLSPVENIPDAVSETLCGQSWAAKANVVFYWSMMPYRAEWRYGIYAHRVALIDVGHVGQNLCLAATALGLGACPIAAFQDALCTQLFGLDGQEEYVVYTMPVGTVRDADKAGELAFYQFVQDEGL